MLDVWQGSVYASVKIAVSLIRPSSRISIKQISTRISIFGKQNPHYRSPFPGESKTIVTKKRKDTLWKYGLHCWYFCLNLKYLGWSYGEYIKTAKYVGFCGELEGENDFEAVLATFCCYNYGANASGGSSEDHYRSKRLSQMLLVCYSLLNS